jgi:hypothetical protein
MALFASRVRQTKVMEIDTRVSQPLEGLVPSQNGLAQRCTVDFPQQRWRPLTRAAVSVPHSQTLFSSYDLSEAAWIRACVSKHLQAFHGWVPGEFFAELDRKLSGSGRSVTISRIV